MRVYLKYILQLFILIGFSLSHAGPREDFFRAVDVDADRVVTGLLKQGFDPNTLDDKGQVGLFVALRGGAVKAAQALLADPRTEIDHANAHGETPLMMAALRGQTDMVRTLLDRGAQVNRSGWTPLHYAASGGDPALVALLLDRGAAIDALSPNGTTPLMMAARYGAIDSADLLLRRGANARLRNQRGMDAADFAAGAGRDALAARLKPR
jgi:ankyrin repeat protein